MRCFLIALGIVLVGATAVQAEFIKPIGGSATSSVGALADAGVVSQLWNDAADTTYEQSKPTTSPDTTQWLATLDTTLTGWATAKVILTLDLGDTYDITGFYAWRYLGDPTDLTLTGYASPNKFGIYGSADGTTWNLIHYNDAIAAADSRYQYTKLGVNTGDSETVQTRTWADMADPAKGNLPTGDVPNAVVNPDNALGIRYVQFQFENNLSGVWSATHLYHHVVGLGELAFETTAVPEPGSLSIFACGLAGLLAYAWRRRR